MFGIDTSQITGTVARLDDHSTVTGPVITIPRDSAVRLEQQLASKADTIPFDDLAVYEWDQGQAEGPAYFLFSGTTLQIGRYLNEYPTD